MPPPRQLLHVTVQLDDEAEERLVPLDDVVPEQLEDVFLRFLYESRVGTGSHHPLAAAWWCVCVCALRRVRACVILVCVMCATA